MAASVFDSPLYARLFDTGEAGRLYSDSAAIRAMLLVEGALAREQGKLATIPQISAEAIYRASLEIQIDPGALAQTTGQNGVLVPGLVAAFRAEMKAPEHAQYVHWGATSQDIIDTGLMMRLRQSLVLAEQDLRAILTTLAHQAEVHASTPMPARTYGQQATPTTWGAVLAQWGEPLVDAVETLPTLRASSLLVSLSGAAGTAAVLGPDITTLRKALAGSLNLSDPGRSWHADRTPLMRITDWFAGVTATLGAMGHSLIGLSGTEVGEVRFGASGASSTMPQKQNPVGASALLALAHQMVGLRAGMQAAAMHQHQRDAASWFAEWMTLPQIALTAAAGLQNAKALTDTLEPDVAHMRSAFEDGLGLVHAEALSFALAAHLTRPEAQAETKALCLKAIATRQPLAGIARAAYPDLPEALFQAEAQTGHAAPDARRFVARVRAL